MVFYACHCNVDFESADTANGFVVLKAHIRPFICVWCDPESVAVQLGHFVAGNYVQKIRIEATVDDSLGSHLDVGTFEVPFTVAATCQKFPGRILPFLDVVQIGMPKRCEGCPQVACAGDSIPVLLAGNLLCATLESVKVVASPIVGPEPEPEMIEITYGINSCAGVACPQVLIPWNAMVKLSALPPRDNYFLIVQVAFDDACVGGGPRPYDARNLPFTVQLCDTLLPPPGACFDARFVQRPGGVCDDFIAAGQPAHATFEVAPTISLAGMQGAFRFDVAGLNVTGIEPTGAASGMHVFWNPDPDGAHFVLYSDNGQLIPPKAPVWSDPWEPVLQVTVQEGDDVIVADKVRLQARDLLAADSVGAGVPHCPQITAEYRDRDATFCPPGEGACDLNHDGHSDVRDLVMMALCITGAGACPDTSGGALDCDGNGVVDLGDVICCAHHVLDQKPPDVQGNDDHDQVTVAMGSPRAAVGGLDVPISVYSTGGLGAARLDLTFPSDRYEATGVDFGSQPGWLSLSQKGDGTIALAWIAAGVSPARDLNVPNGTLHLRLKAGATNGGDLTVAASQFAAPTGAALRVSAAGLSIPLSGGRVALSSPLPNPSGGRTSFSVMLAEAGTLDIGVFDAGGRRIATVFHGSAAAGVRTFSWDGRRDSGVAAGSGLFFVRAESQGTKVTSKIMLLSPR